MNKIFQLAVNVSIFTFVFGSMLFVQEANGASLWWSATEINTNNVNACLDFGVKALQAGGFTEVKGSGSEATGVKGNTYTSIACVGTPNKVNAVIMVSGRAGSNVQYIHDKLRESFLAYPAVPVPPTPSSSSSMTSKMASVPIRVSTNPPTPQTPLFLNWRTTRVLTDTVEKCYQLARDDFSKLSNFRETKGVELSGSNGTSYAAVKCFATNSFAIAVIVVVGDDNAQTLSTLNRIRTPLSKRVFID